MPTKIHFRLEQDEDGYPPSSVESLWAEPGEIPGEYIIDNVPFFARCVTIGDTVSVHEENEALWFDHLVSRSSNSLLRIVFFDRSCEEAVGKHLIDMGCAIEFLRKHNLMAVSIPDTVALKNVQAYLQLEAEGGRIDYEEPILRQPA